MQAKPQCLLLSKCPIKVGTISKGLPWVREALEPNGSLFEKGREIVKVKDQSSEGPVLLRILSSHESSQEAVLGVGIGMEMGKK